MKHKDKILSLVNSYAAICGGDPDGADATERNAELTKITEFLTAPESVKEAINQLEEYLLDRSKSQMATGLLSGAEGDILFKLNQIKDFLAITSENESKG